jgi:hypothetical protein
MSYATALHHSAHLACPSFVHKGKLGSPLRQTACPLLNSFLGSTCFHRLQLHSPRKTHLRFRQHCSAPRASLGSSSGNVSTDFEGGRALFRAEQRRAEVVLPALVVGVGAREVLEGGKALTQSVEEVCAGGATMVLLTEGGEEARGAGGGALYEAACVLQGVIRGRAQLLIADRADIAAAAGADGVLLSEQGEACKDKWWQDVVGCAVWKVKCCALLVRHSRKRHETCWQGDGT